MKIDDIHQVRSEAVQSQAQSLHESIQNLSSRLARRQEIVKTNQEEQTETVHWTNVYKKWDDWEDTEDIQKEIKESKQKLTKLKRNHEKTNRKKVKNESFCCSSQNRDDEKRVILMTTQERLEHMKSFRRDHGNLEYGKGKYEDARKWYDKSLIYYEYCFLSSGEEFKQVEEERLLCLLNISACYLALKRYNDCIESCNEALEISTCTNEHKVKALLRRAKAYRCTLQFQNSKNDLDDAKNSITTLKMTSRIYTRDLDYEYQLLTKATEKYELDSKDLARRMINKC